MKDMCKLVPRTPPEGLKHWIYQTVGGELCSGLVYQVEWVEDYGLDYLLDEWSKPKKRKMVRATCSGCGWSGLLEWAGDPQHGYGFVLPEDMEGDWDRIVTAAGDKVNCPCCETPVLVQKRSAIRDYYVVDEGTALSAALLGEESWLVLTGWTVQNRVYKSGTERLEIIPAEAYVFGSRDRTKLMGWKNSYSGTCGYFVSYTKSWRQPKGWRDSWEETGEIFGLTPELVERSCLPHCKLDVYMASRVGAKHYPVSYLQLYQDHPGVEHVLVHGLPRVLDDLMAGRMSHRRDGGRPDTMDLPELDWEEARPAQMLRLTKEELRMARSQDWGVFFWELFLQAKRFGETLTAQDMTNAFCLGDDHLDQLPGIGPVAKSIRYLLKQCECLAVEAEDEDPPVGSIPDVQTLIDYWTMAETLGRDLEDPSVRFPRDLIAAHDDMTVLLAQRKIDAMAGQFRIRRKLLSRYSFAADGLLIRPAASQAELTREGDALHHCVGMYGKRHVQGETAIFFIRRASNPREPFYTLELDEKNLAVRQNRGLCNCARTPEVQAFEELWLSWLKAGSRRDKGGKPILPGKRKEVA